MHDVVLSNAGQIQMFRNVLYSEVTIQSSLIKLK